MQNQEEKLALRLLATLYELGRADLAASVDVLATWLDVPATRVQAIICALDAQGLMDQARCRLTMRGLVLAVSMHGAQKLSRQRAAA